ncbi:hypothetical protein [Nitrosomonas sp.]|uniref:hypothetical protein n=1 Tax=Nitrosomonas sp. TaxID=42353 RepID=UPI0025F27C1A|nr:hypothetical protein [Nitrosomonas sp.]
MIRYIAYTFLLLLIAVPFVLAGILYLVMADQPTVNRVAEFTPAHIERAKHIIKTNDPRTMKPGVLRTLALSQEEVDLTVNYLASRYARGSSRIVLQPGKAMLSASFELPSNPFGRFLNISALLHESDGFPVFDQLQIGQLSIPEWLADMLFEYALRQLNAREDYRIASDTVKKISVADGRFIVTYDWQADLPDRIRSILLPHEEQARLKAYQERLAENVRSGSGTAEMTLADVMAPLFRFAAERSTSGDAVAENRAAIVVLAFFVNGKGLGVIVPAARDWPQLPPHKVLLDGREDFSQHFTISAAIAANAAAPLSNAIGLYKEVDDSRSGSGFSFNDIAADRAGTRFGVLAANNNESALKLQRQVAAGIRDSDILPRVADLPEFMPETEFRKRFGGIDSPAYKRIMDEIERRIAALPLYR